MPRPKAVNNSLLEAALEGLELQRQRLDEQIREVRARLGQRSGRGPGRPSSKQASAAPANGRRRRRTLSAEARKRIAAAQKKRWAAFRKKTAGAGS